MANNKVYAFLGPHAAGKASMVSQLVSMGIHYIPTITTKYFDDRYAYKRKLFRTVKPDAYAAEKLIINNGYQGSSYGVRKNDVLEAYQQHKISIMIMMDTDGIKQVSKFINQDLVTIFLMINDEVFIERMLRAGCSNDEIKYFVEYAETNKEFEKWRDVNFVVKNTASARVALEQILAIMGLVTLVPQADFDNLIK
ncbi:MAG: guanylate kinase [Selenomonadaceae bacterium]|nr:guanylate kinase [Selenomonadaceae bacterium]